MSANEDACTVTVRSAGAVQPANGDLLGVPLRDWRARSASELGLPAAELRVGTGHQAELWHPGILAKYVWADELAHRAGCAVLHLLVDTDTRDPLAFHAPVLKGEALRIVHHTFGAPIVGAGRNANRPEAAACSRPASAPIPLLLDAASFALPCVAEGAKRIERALAQFAGEPDAAAQAWHALRSLLSQQPGLGESSPFATVPWVRTSQLMQTSLGKALLDRAQQDPVACASAFNAATRRVPRSARPLEETSNMGTELPFWTLQPEGSRRRVAARQLPTLRESGVRLAPAALLISAIARAALCDRFVHGTGGEIYEQATEIFIEQWLGAHLPPFDTATATVRLPFERASSGTVVTPAARRSAWFDPEAAFASPHASAGPSGPKRALLAAVNAAPRRTPQRRAAWRAMHAQLDRSRGMHAAELAQLAERERADRERAREALVRNDRTWPVPLYPPALITQMAARLRQTP